MISLLTYRNDSISLFIVVNPFFDEAKLSFLREWKGHGPPQLGGGRKKQDAQVGNPQIAFTPTSSKGSVCRYCEETWTLVVESDS